MPYTLLKHLHATTVLVTLSLFLLRGWWMINQSPRGQARWTRIVPHINDTVLLVAAISMVVIMWGNPLQHPWIMAKISGLLAYIALGKIALTPTRSRNQRIAALIAALLVFGYIIAVAVTKQAVPGLS